MNYSYLFTKAGKILAKGTLFRVGKYLAKKGGKTGIIIGGIAAGSFLAYQMWQEREQEKDQQLTQKITGKKKKIVV
ncbi:hypothetical protein C7S20_03745 [Christiangramia fulva]|uniref:Uncharacterized protein n=1 Tax=Christiangramia fulva TaxID=2126553 RepID=A0A2R3Z2D8_9FLAO|nr:hypothetical protein [Christiangramia fulva]AVR44443.1 hypothetical protein C7S20_03745 [Christiangramia fulva]